MGSLNYVNYQLENNNNKLWTNDINSFYDELTKALDSLETAINSGDNYFIDDVSFLKNEMKIQKMIISTIITNLRSIILNSSEVGDSIELCPIEGCPSDSSMLD